MNSTDGPREFAGRVIITWPAPAGRALAAPLVALYDAESGDPLLATLELHLSANDDELIHCDLVEFCDENGEPLRGRSITPIITDEYRAHLDAVRGTNPGFVPVDQAYARNALAAEFTGEHFRTTRRRYLVAEMRIGAPMPAPPTREEG